MTHTAPPSVRDRREELDLDKIGEFHVLWYHRGPAVGPFHSTAQLAEYMRSNSLGRPDELFTPFLDAG